MLLAIFSLCNYPLINLKTFSMFFYYFSSVNMMLLFFVTLAILCQVQLLLDLFIFRRLFLTWMYRLSLASEKVRGTSFEALAQVAQKSRAHLEHYQELLQS